MMAIDVTPRYFAYGSNLDLQDWHRWCRRKGYREELLQPLFKAFLPDRALAFAKWSRTRECGVLDIRPATGHLVEGVVFAVKGDGWDALGRKEGAPRAYQAIDIEALTFDGMAHPVRTFEVVPGQRQQFVAPNDDYLRIVGDGYRAFGMATEALDAAAIDAPAPSALTSVFVYGTLMCGESRSAMLGDDSGTIAVGRVPGALFDLGDYPGLQADPSRLAWVVGEIRAPVDGSAVEALDRIEGFPGFESPGGLFRRRIAEVSIADGRLGRAWVYVLADKRTYPRIDGGDWRAHQRGRSAAVRH